MHARTYPHTHAHTHMHTHTYPHTQEHAFEASQKYKEGKFIIELAHMVKENRWE